MNIKAIVDLSGGLKWQPINLDDFEGIDPNHAKSPSWDVNYTLS